MSRVTVTGGASGMFAYINSISKNSRSIHE
jgi:hypothetical protein